MGSITALGTDDFEFLAIVNDHVVSKVVTEGYVMPAIQPELPPGQDPVKDVPEQFRAFVAFFVLFRHGCLQNKESPAIIGMTGLRGKFWFDSGENLHQPPAVNFWLLRQVLPL
jgi:hypothetical protein